MITTDRDNWGNHPSRGEVPGLPFPNPLPRGAGARDERARHLPTSAAGKAIPPRGGI